MKNIIMNTAWFLSGITATAQDVIQAEYFIDVDKGLGSNTIFTFANPLPDGSYNLNISLTGEAVGNHKLYIRTKDSNGKWSLTTRKDIEVVSSNIIKKIVGGAYFFDVDPGFNLAATSITISPQDTAILQNFTAVTGSLPVGYHKLYIRLKDNDGKWSLTTRRNIEVIRSDTYLIAGAEYFFISDPGVGKASPVSFNLPNADGSFDFKIPLNNIPGGTHTLYIRARDSINNNWSITQWQRDSIVTSIQAGKWSQPATWSNNKVPDGNTVVLLYHNVDVDIVNAVCKSLTPYGSNVSCNVEAGKALKITGYK
ncbi:MAG: hypothetical protein ABI760_00360 [Ferruginibacter sp.]